MKEYELEALLEKYYKGETTLSEERQIKAYLSQNTFSPAFKTDKQWFSQLQQEKQIHSGEKFDQRLEAMFAEKKLDQAGKTNTRSLFIWPYQIAALVIMVLGLSLVAYLDFVKKQAEWVEMATTEQETRQILLPDGSKVWLNRASSLRYGKQFKAASREVWLKGEAYFEVSHNPGKPFLIHTSGTTTQVLGTSFNIRSYQQESTVKVGVISGKVSFTAQDHENDKQLILQPGHGAVFNKAKKAIEKKEKMNPNLLAWKTHQLKFEDAPLQEVIAALEEYFYIHIKVENAGVLNCRFKGVFKEAKLGEILEVMQYSMNVSAVQQGDYYILSGNGCQ